MTARDVALYQAWVEVDGPWWGEREDAQLRQLCSISAAAAGVPTPPDEFRLEWQLGGADGPAVNLLSPADGLAAFAAINGLDVTPEPSP